MESGSVHQIAISVLGAADHSARIIFWNSGATYFRQ
jgi:hypothetical protein